MYLNNIAVKNLFGDNLNPEIEFDKNNSITYILGRNGCGKTTLLRIIESISNRNWSYLEELYFDNITLSFNDNTIKLSISQKHATDENHISDSFFISFTDTKKNININNLSLEINDFEISDFDTLAKKLIANGVIEKLPCGHWKSEKKSHMRKKEVINLYGNNFVDIPIEVSTALSKFKVNFIDSERLLGSKNEDSSEFYQNKKDYLGNSSKKTSQSKCYKIDNISDDIRRRLQRTQQQVLRKLESISDELMSSLLKNGISKFSKITEEDFHNLLSSYNEDRKRFDSVGLSSGRDIANLRERTIDNSERALIAYIINKRIEAYQPYKDVIVSYELFNEIVNSAITRKKISITLSEGLKVEISNGKTFPVDHLSSGEQHIVILAHTLLFEMISNSLALIDEPEISMDVEWQSKLSEWLDKVGKERNLKFILATHSPLVLSGRNYAIRTLNV